MSEWEICYFPDWGMNRQVDFAAAEMGLHT